MSFIGYYRKRVRENPSENIPFSRAPNSKSAPVSLPKFHQLLLRCLYEIVLQPEMRRCGKKIGCLSCQFYDSTKRGKQTSHLALSALEFTTSNIRTSNLKSLTSLKISSLFLTSSIFTGPIQPSSKPRLSPSASSAKVIENPVKSSFLFVPAKPESKKPYL